MQNPFVPFSGIYQTQLEASRRFAATFFAGTEKIDHVLLDATHSAFSDQLNLVQSIAGMQDSQSVGNAASVLPKHPEWMLDCQRELINIFSEMQDELSQSMRQYLDDVGQNALAIASAQEESRAVDGVGFNPVTGMFSVWENAFREAASLAGRDAEAANTAYASVNEGLARAGNEAAGSSSHRTRKSSASGRHTSHAKRGR